jgi:tetraacyldisaccharide 4'-kinase
MRRPDFWEREGSSFPGALLAPLGRLVAAGGWLRTALVRPVAVPVPVICVGEATVGGSGKTPVAMAVVRMLQAQGAAPHVLLRGYGGRLRGPLRVDPARHGARDVGDEAVLHARRCPTWIGTDRVRSARAAVAAGASHLVLDDGLQNPHLQKTLRLLVIDALAGIGNGRVLPAGPLREPFARALARADAVVVLGEGRGDDRLPLPPEKPVLCARLVPREAGGLAGRRVLAFAGIGRTEKFFQSCALAGCRVEERVAFPDHHRYRPRELARLRALAARRELAIITTEKDFVRLPTLWRPLVTPLALELVWDDARLAYNLMQRQGCMEQCRAPVVSGGAWHVS